MSEGDEVTTSGSDEPKRWKRLVFRLDASPEAMVEAMQAVDRGEEPPLEAVLATWSQDEGPDVTPQPEALSGPESAPAAGEPKGRLSRAPRRQQSDGR